MQNMRTVPFIALAFWTVFIAPIYAATDSIYALGLQPNESGTQDLILYSVDTSTRSLKSVLTVAPNPQLAVIDLERSVIAVPTPALAPTQVNILRTNSPGTIRQVSLHYEAPDLPYSVVELEPIEGETFLAFALGHSVASGLIAKSALTGVSLLRVSEKTESLSLSDLAYPRVMGLIGDQFPQNSKLMPEVRGNPLRPAFYPDPGVALGIPGPPTPTESWLAINSDELAVLLPFKESRNESFDVFDKQKRVWQTIRTPFPSLFVRPFGYWLAFIASDPAEGTRVPFPPGATYSFSVVPGGYQAGSAEKRKDHIVYWRDSIEDQMLMSGHNHPGKLFVVNVKTGASYEIDTGEADSEVVWVDQERVIYRINDQLLEARIGPGRLLAPTTIASGDEVFGTHWIFKGPAIQEIQR